MTVLDDAEAWADEHVPDEWCINHRPEWGKITEAYVAGYLACRWPAFLIGFIGGTMTGLLLAHL